MNCRVCGMDCSTDIWTELPAHRGKWHKCWACGSDFNESKYEDIRPSYDGHYVDHNVREIGFDGCVREHSVNVWMFDKHREGCPDNTFLDIGCLEGSGMAAMAQSGWSVHGFDIIPESKEKNPPGDHVTISESFHANLFPRKYSAVMAREVVEHVPDWKNFLKECYEVTQTNGLFQIQTPRAIPKCIGYVYFGDHLQIFSPYALRDSLEKVGFRIIDSKIWDSGQLWLTRKT